MQAWLQCVAVLAANFLLFALGHMFETYVQPLVGCLAAGFFLVNHSNLRD
jgi:hypothetical protein